MDLPITILPDEPNETHHAARAFCLKLIKEFYNIDYTPAWHADLDSLVTLPSRNWYASMNRGTFWTCHDEKGVILATCGIYSMTWKTETLKRLNIQCANDSTVCQLSRMYVRQDMRRCGIGKIIQNLATSEAITLGYSHLYLHADANITDTLAFWDSCGYTRIGAPKELQIIDYIKKLHP